MSYTCEVSDNVLSVLPTRLFLIFILSFILGASISFITSASFGIIVNWVLDNYQSISHSNLQRIHPLEVIDRV